MFLFVVRNNALGGESWCRWYLGRGATVVGRALVWKMALEQAVKRQGRLGFEQHCPWVRGPALPFPTEDAGLQSSSAFPLGQDLSWSRFHQFSGCPWLQ